MCYLIEKPKDAKITSFWAEVLKFYEQEYFLTNMEIRMIKF